MCYDGRDSDTPHIDLAFMHPFFHDFAQKDYIHFRPSQSLHEIHTLIYTNLKYPDTAEE